MNRILSKTAVICFLMSTALYGGGLLPVNVAVENSVVSIKDGYEPQWLAGKEAKIELASAMGEYESVQLIIEANEDVEISEAGINDFKSGLFKKISSANIQLRTLENVGGFDDALVPFRTLSLKANERKVLWFTVKIPHTAAAGNYKTNIVLYGTKGRLSIPVMLRVHKFRLPITPSIPALFGISDNMFKIRYGTVIDSDEFKVMADQWYQFVLDYRISPYLCRWVNDSMQHHAYPCPWEVGTPQCEKYLADQRLAAFAVPYHNLDTEAFRKTIKYLEDNNFMDKGYFYLYDEPSKSAQYEQIKTWAKEIHSIVPQGRVLTTFYCGLTDGPFKDDLYAVPELLGDSTQILCMSIWAAGGEEANVEKIKSKILPNQQWWSYVCCGPGSPQPNLLMEMTGFQNRAVMWRVWKEGGKGFLYWAVNSFDFDGSDGKGSPIRIRSGLPAGDGVLVYPGDMFGVDGVVASVRLERWRDGAEDYEYLKAYQDKLGRDAALIALQPVYQGPTQYTDDEQNIEKMRRQILTTVSR